MIDAEYIESLRAHWEPRKTVCSGSNSAMCSACWTIIQNMEQEFDFCPHCGRPMTKKAERILVKRFCPDDGHDEKTPCSNCAYDPPSSGDGKPCTMCPAIPKND